VEVDEAEAAGIGIGTIKDNEQPPHKQAVEEMINCINVAADFEDALATGDTGRRTWVALKLVRALGVENKCPFSNAHCDELASLDGPTSRRSSARQSFVLSGQISSA
jgi:hypothetical protein